jgi:hypothetical protein
LVLSYISVPVSGGTGSSTIANHTDSQVSNAFSFQNKTNEPLFAFNLIPNSGNATVTSLTIDLSGARNVSVADFSNLRLYKDHNNNANYDVTDEQVGGAGTMSAAGQHGDITFETDFLATTTTNYIFVADFNAPAKGSSLNFDLYPSGVSMLDADGGVVVNGSVDRIQHNRSESRGGGGGSAAAVGGAAPAGDGDVGGGTNDGGEQIGEDPDFYWPSSEIGSWSGPPANAYDQLDGTYTQTNMTVSQTFNGFVHGVPESDSIEGIEVKLEVSGSTAAGSIGVELSWNSRSSFTSTGYTTGVLTTTDTVITLGSPTDLWGHSWMPSEVDGSFSVRVTGSPSTNNVRIDAIQVKVYHQASGGGAGGGGRI